VADLPFQPVCQAGDIIGIILLVHEHGARNITGFPYGPEHNVIAI
jgi:hypothetical protein